MMLRSCHVAVRDSGMTLGRTNAGWVLSGQWGLTYVPDSAPWALTLFIHPHSDIQSDNVSHTSTFFQNFLYKPISHILINHQRQTVTLPVHFFLYNKVTNSVECSSINSLYAMSWLHQFNLFALKLPQLKRSAHRYSVSTTFLLIDIIKYGILMFRGKKRFSHDVSQWLVDDQLRKVLWVSFHAIRFPPKHYWLC